MNKNILFIIDLFPPYSYRGGEISTSLLTNALAKRGDYCFILTAKTIKIKPDFKNIFIFPKLIIPFIKEERNTNYIIRILNYFYFVINNLYWFLYIVIKYKIDIIHCVPLFYPSLLLTVTALITRKPQLIDIHGEILTPDYMSKFLDKEKPTSNLYFNVCSQYDIFLYSISRFLTKKLVPLKKNLLIVTPSKFLKNILITNGYDKDKLKIVNNLNTTSSILSLSKIRTNTIVYAGALENYKGIWDVINAYIQLNNIDINLKIIGDGNERKRIIDFISKRNIKNITVINAMDHDHLLAVYCNSKIIIAPSKIPESFGRFIQESAITGTPLITTNIGAIPESIINYYNGILVNPGDVTELVNAINRLLTDKELYIKISNNISKLKEVFSEKETLDKRYSFYSQILNS